MGARASGCGQPKGNRVCKPSTGKAAEEVVSRETGQWLNGEGLRYIICDIRFLVILSLPDHLRNLFK
jgi:hypothetical protein